MTRTIAFLISALLVCAILSASAEEKPVFPPLHSWAEFEDMTDKVIEWNVPVGKIETYSLLDPIPPLPEPGPFCKAPPELDSFADGTGIPVQVGIGKEPQHPGINYMIGERRTTKDLSMEMVKAGILGLQDRPKYRSASPAKADPIFLSPEAKKAFDSCIQKMSEFGGVQVVCLEPGHFFAVVKQAPDFYGIFRVKAVYEVLLSRDGTVRTTEVSDLTGFDFIASFHWREGCPNKGSAVFLDDDSNLHLLKADRTTSQQPFRFKPTMGTGVWNPARDFQLSWVGDWGTDATAFPVLAVFERNYGIPRDSIIPRAYDMNGRPTVERDAWEQNAPLKPDVPRSRIVLQDLTTGEVFLDKEGIFELWPLGSGNFMYPMVASKGQWNFAVVGRKGFIRLIPYASVFPAGEYFANSREERILSVAPKSISATYRPEAIHRRILLDRPHDLATFGSLGQYGMGVSEPFTSAGRSVRQVWKFDIRRGIMEYSFLMEDVFQPGSRPCSVVLYDGFTLLLFTGEKYGKIELRRPE